MRDLESLILSRLSDALAEAADHGGVWEVLTADLPAEIADDAVIYNADAAELIRQYESEYGDEAEYLCAHEKFGAADWQKAQISYAAAIVYCVATRRIEEWLAEVVEVLERVANHVETLSGEVIDPFALRYTRDCPHGWAPHDRETNEGDCVREPSALEGCHAVAGRLPRELGWVSWTWTP